MTGLPPWQSRPAIGLQNQGIHSNSRHTCLRPWRVNCTHKYFVYKIYPDHGCDMIDQMVEVRFFANA